MTLHFDRPDMDDLPHTEWRCEECDAVNSCLDGDCQYCESLEAEAHTEYCYRCSEPCKTPEGEYGEFICDDCAQNAAEAAYERHCEDFHDGGCTRFNSLQAQQIEARRLK